MMMFGTTTVNRQLLKGVAIGVGVSAVAFYAYKKHEESVNSFLKSHGVDVPQAGGKDYYTMSLEELMQAKETIEDIIAEKDLGGVTVVSSEA